MTNDQTNRDIANHSRSSQASVRNTTDPLPWLIRNLRQKQDELANDCQTSESHTETTETQEI